jgi:type IV pilus assembly protein PilC
VAVYAYRARDELGKLVRGSLAAQSEDDLARALEGSRLYLVSAKEGTAGRSRGWSLERIGRRDLIAFCDHMALSLRAGVPLMEALRDFEQHAERRRMREAVTDVLEALAGGSNFSESLALAPGAFPELFVAIVRTGEATGRLDAVLKDLARFLSWQEELAGQVRHATYYPASVMIAVGGLSALLVGFVFPRFMVIFEKSKLVLPLPTRIVMGVSHVLTTYWLLIILGLVAAPLIYRWASRRPAGRLIIDRVKLRLPIFGPLVSKVALSRFSHYLEAMLKGGVEIMHSIEVTEKVVGNEVYRRALAQAREAVSTGQPLSEALQATGKFPPLVVRMVSLGELSGQLDEVLGQLNGHYDQEIPAIIKKVFSAVEPLVIAVLAFVVLGMALSMFLPLYEMLNSVAKGG